MRGLEAAQSLSGSAEAAAWTFTGLATALFIIRLISRFHILKKPINWEDVIVVVSWILAICRAIFFQIALSAIQHIDRSDKPGTVPNAAFWIFFTEHWTFLSVSLPKCAIALLIVELFRPEPWVKNAIWVCCVLICTLALVGFFASTFNCRPIPYQWDPYKYEDGHCWSQVAVNILGGLFSIYSALVDLLFAVYPGFVIWNLKLSTFKRLSTMALMGLGLASCTFATIKVVCMLELRGKYPPMEQRIWDGMLVSFWCSLENDFIVSAACLPLSPPFFRTGYGTCKECFASCKESFGSSALRKRLRRTSYRLKDCPSRESSNDDGKA